MIFAVYYVKKNTVQVKHYYVFSGIFCQWWLEIIGMGPDYFG